MTHAPLPVVESGAYSELIGRVIDNTAMSAFQECRWKYYASMVLHRRKSKRGQNSAPLSYGTSWHAMLAAHYRTDGDRSEVVLALIDSWEDHGVIDDHRTPKRLELAYDAYVKTYGRPSDEARRGDGKTVMGLIEQAVELTFPNVRHPYTGKLDRLIELNGMLYVEDHKTSSQLGDRYFEQWELDPQMLGYAALARRLVRKPIHGVRINAHGVLKTENKFARKVISFSEAQLDDFERNLDEQFQEIEWYAARGVWPRNWKSCHGKFGPCQYKGSSGRVGVCSSAPRLRMQALEADFDIEPWDPLEAIDD